MAVAPRFIVGLDIGKVSDPTALGVLERHIRLTQGAFDVSFDTRYLERVPLRTPYPVMVRGVRERLEHLGEPCVLVIDATGVGLAVVDLFRDAWTEYDTETLARRTLPGKPVVIAVTLTNGQTAHPDPMAWDNWYVPKWDVIDLLIVLLQQERFRIARQLPDAAVLIKEAQHFEPRKVARAGQDDYLAWREHQHDDLVLAVAIAAWWGKHTAPKPRQKPPVRDAAYAGPHGWMS